MGVTMILRCLAVSMFFAFTLTACEDDLTEEELEAIAEEAEEAKVEVDIPAMPEPMPEPDPEPVT
jgi:hypothetical protein